MIYRKLGKSSVEVSEISLGCWTMGGLNWEQGRSSGWANVSEDDIVEAVKLAVDSGINHFDNADVYGDGEAERMLARVLKKLGLPSERFVIATKIGHLRDPYIHPFDPRWIRQQCERSLQNLGRDFIDLYYLHHADFGPEDRYLPEAAETLNALQREGKIRLKGQSAYASRDFSKAVPVIKPDVLQSWAHMMDTRFVEPTGIVGQLLATEELSFVAFSPLNQGLLLGKYDPSAPPKFPEGDHRGRSQKFTTEALLKLQPKMDALKERFGSDTRALASVALRYPLAFPRVACVIPGFRNAPQVEANLGAVERQLSSEDIAAIQSIF